VLEGCRSLFSPHCTPRTGSRRGTDPAPWRARARQVRDLNAHTSLPAGHKALPCHGSASRRRLADFQWPERLKSPATATVTFTATTTLRRLARREPSLGTGPSARRPQRRCACRGITERMASSVASDEATEPESTRHRPDLALAWPLLGLSDQCKTERFCEAHQDDPATCRSHSWRGWRSGSQRAAGHREGRWMVDRALRARF